jgi:glucose/arabinose dehydrogenase
MQWSYDPATMKVSNQKTVVKGMDSGIHSTRNVLVVPSEPNMILLQVGSNANLDMASAQKETGRAIIKMFDMSKVPEGGWNYKTDGVTFAYGLRNEIGFTPDPQGIIWGVENSGDVSYRHSWVNDKSHAADPAQRTSLAPPTAALSIFTRITQPKS